MLRSLPLIPTILVGAAVLTMIALGIWQLGRADEKEAMLQRYAAAGGIEAPVAFPRDEDALALNLYRRSALDCERVLERRATAGTSDKGVKGWAQMARCATADAGEVEVALGWTRQPQGPQWTGGPVEGIVAPGPRLVADPPRAGLIPLARPDPSDLPNNHLAYAGQWFFFALTALVIYVIALRRRRRDAAGDLAGDED